MLFHVQVRACLAYALLFCSSSRFTIALPLTAESIGDASNELSEASSRILERSTGPQVSSQLAQQSNFSDSAGALNLSSTNPLNRQTFIWEISDTLSLTINPGSDPIPSDKILATLAAADAAVGKKRAAALLEEKFTQKTGSFINRMIFEIEPDPEGSKLTWADVGEVVKDNGLASYFRQQQEWYNTEFELFDDIRGKLGEGAVRKWYMNGFGGGNDTALAGGDLDVA